MTRIERIAILSPGKLGSQIGFALYKAGFDVMTCLEGRSNRTRVRAFDSRIREVGSYERLMEEAELVLSIVPPEAAMVVAERVARALEVTRERLVFADCNAVASLYARRMEEAVTRGGSSFISAAILGGGACGGLDGMRVYCSGRDTLALESLRPAGLDVRVVRPRLGEVTQEKTPSVA